jgi:two-component system cell cycle sensor histidine kinase/response regulator CckA
MTESHVKNRAVLIADDDPVVLLLMGEALAAAGFSVTAVEDGSQAVSAFQSLRPDLVVLDVQMPHLDGFGACREIRGSAGGLRVPIVMATGLEDVEAIERAYAVGATDFITKPVNWMIFIQRVRYMMRAADSVEAWLGTERENRALLDAIPDSMFKLDPTGTVLQARCAEREPFPIFSGDPTGRLITEVTPPDIGHRSLRHLREALEHGRSSFECRLSEDGRRGDFEVRLVDAGEGEVLAIVRDVTDQKRVAAETLRSQKLEALGRLAGSVAHDFNNVLTVISGFAQLISLDSTDDQSVRHNVGRIIQAAEHAGVLTRQLTSFSKEEMSDPQILNLNDVISDLEDILRRILGEEIEFRSKLQSELGQVKIDKVRFEQVLINLIMNARDAMPGGGSLTIETQMESDGSEKPGGQIAVSVSDTGAGIPEDVASRIFEPFFTTKKDGTGLGLSTSEQIVKESGGELCVQSEPDAGTTFSIVLPAAGDALEPGDRPRDAVSKLPRGSETIMVVEDDDMVREVTCRTLESLGYTVLSASNAVVALEMSRVRPGIDLLLADVVMTGLSGPDLAAQLAVERPSVRVLYMSGNMGDAMVRYGVVTKDVDLMRKPFTPEALARRVRQSLDRKLPDVPEGVGAPALETD